MITVVLVCSGGISASIFLKKLNKLAQLHQVQLDMKTCSIHEIEGTVDILLLSPQCAYAEKKMMSYVTDPNHIIVINGFAYSSLDVQHTMDLILNILYKGG